MPFEATQEQIRETLEQVQQILTRLEPVLHKLLMSGQVSLQTIESLAAKDLPGIAASALAILGNVSEKNLPEVSQTLQRLRQLCHDVIALLGQGVTVDLRDLKVNDWSLSGRIAIAPNNLSKETKR